LLADPCLNFFESAQEKNCGAGHAAMTSAQFGQQLIFEALKPLVEQHEATSASGRLGKKSLVAPFKFPATPYEYKVIALRECPTPESLQMCDTPDKAVEYWRLHVPAIPYFNPECECFSVFLLNTRRRVKGHQFISIGILDTLIVHPREVFRLAVMTAAAAIVLAHNHPSGDPTPSEADVKVTRDLIRAGQLLKIEVLDHVIIGNPSHTSLRELGYFYQ
jgi:proteasome lid subunit RPN8/RPN11